MERRLADGSPAARPWYPRAGAVIGTKSSHVYDDRSFLHRGLADYCGSLGLNLPHNIGVAIGQQKL